MPPLRSTKAVLFQFLGRNSGRSDVGLTDPKLADIAVSIPRSEFWSFGLNRENRQSPTSVCFNSSVGILVVRTTSARHTSAKRRAGFNSSVGILVVRTQSWRAAAKLFLQRFNSSVGILVVRTGRLEGAHALVVRRFNSSVGILVVRTTIAK